MPTSSIDHSFVITCTALPCLLRKGVLVSCLFFSHVTVLLAIRRKGRTKKSGGRLPASVSATSWYDTTGMAEAEREEDEATPVATATAPVSPSRAQRFLAAARALFANVVMPGQGTQTSLFGQGTPVGRELLLVECDPCEEDCPICLTPLDAGVIETPCNHKFHAACLERYFLGAREPGSRARCPLCRGVCHAPLPVEVHASSGRPIEVVAVPGQGGRCHFDRPYYFLDLGSFASIPGMLYVMTSNDDRKTPAAHVMWTLEAQHPMTVHLNFRSEEHVTNGRCESWLSLHGWARNAPLRSTVSSGTPNGPYSGPVYSKEVPAGRTVLYGSNYWVGHRPERSRTQRQMPRPSLRLSLPYRPPPIHSRIPDP